MKVLIKILSVVIILALPSISLFYFGYAYGGITLRYVLPHLSAFGLNLSAWGIPGFSDQSKFIRHNRHNKKIIVFVHGATGTPTETWTNPNNGAPVSWPSIVEEDERLIDYDIFVLAYASPLLDTGPNIFQLADALNQDLTDHRIYPSLGRQSQYDEVIFICHSMGNLIVRTSMITKPLPKNGPTQIRLILSLASPSAGSSLVDLVNQISSNLAIKEMAKLEGNSFLQLLNSVWTQLAFDTEIACAYELRSYPRLNKTIVDKDSATAVCTRTEHRGIDEDHIGIVKPNSREHPTHQWMVDEIQKPVAKRGWELDRWTRSEIVIGGKDYLESNIHAAMMALVIEAERPDIKVLRQYNMGHASRLHSALRDHTIDIYPEYDGSLLYEYLNRPLGGELEDLDPDAVNRELQKTTQTLNMRYFPHFGFDNPYVFVMLRSTAEALGILKSDGGVSMTDVAKIAPRRLSITGDQEFSFRKEWRALRNAYGLKFREYRFAHHSKIYDELRRSEAEMPRLGDRSGETLGIVGVGFGTDPEVNGKDTGFVVISDDKRSLPIYHPAPLVDRLLLRKFDGIESALAKLAGVMTRREMAELVEATQRELQRALMDGGDPTTEEIKKLELVVRNFLIGKKVIVSGY